MLPIARGVHHLILRVIVSQAAAMVRAETPWILILLSVCWTEGQSGTDVVQIPIGLESGAIAASSLTASSQWAETYGPERGRLNIDVVKAQGGGWVAKKANTKQWIQVDLLTPYHITGVATQGQSGEPQWVTSFKIACSMDDEIFDTVKDPDYPKSDKIFPANSDRNTVVFNPLPAILCRYVRLIPVAWSGFIGLRMELYREGTVAESTPIPTTMTVHTTNPKTAISVQSDPVTSETTADTTTTSQPARGGRRLPPSGLALTKPPHTNDMTNLETTEADLETTAFPKTSGSPQTKTSGEETTSQGSGTKNQSDFTKTPREPRKGLIDTLAQMDEAQTVYVGLCVPMFVYFICFLTALVLRAITMWIQRLNKKKEPPPCMERPRLMYELVRLRSDDLNKCHRRKGIHK
ncbi:neuropilin-1 isoform X3 [Strongylocentrotus purpuratus]|uniref:F5/8 type C domain-containing protein n=1 Tax=Strongylocentrotus purpuratus TaxID=7668 RepID=A0A7M7P9F8_STRPU|nr:neuropilin-1 isoform X3 [Strongylocentrotus purpuratus]